ncbi:MAG: hypothetical protein D6798_07595 [Deltaproteobacteria bacterium]|nr:MAG: hypothetical protein D6798_07595 [Deltaproteobacteria bacterium]
MIYAMTLALALVGCGDKGGSDDTGGTAGDGGATGDGGSSGSDRFDEYINVTTEPPSSEDLDSCTYGEGNWMTQTVISDYQVDISAYGFVQDFESGDGVADAKVQLWWNNDPTGGAPDYEVDSASDGTVTTTWKTCQPIAYKVSTDPALGATVDTYEVNQIDPYIESGTLDVTFNSVSSTTYAIIPSLLGVSPDGDKGTIAGTALDCGGDALEGVQVVITDDAGNIPDSLVVKYFVDSFPNRDQPYTSEDGLWVAINVPEGTWNVDMYAYDASLDDHVLLGRTKAYVFANSIMISNVYTGWEDGKRYPDICVE